jgi:hypothetical protein
MIDKAREYFAPILSVNRRVSVGTSVLGQMRHFT